ncbi:MAG: hypothetical protein GY724_23830 [Actinomycetia bacterium]|nr:hypothetical protein [Actinomycetes bacterium]
MALDTQTVTSFALGVVLGFVLLSLLIPILSRRQRKGMRARIEDYEHVIADLRLDQADDRETNRRLRHQLAVSTPEQLEVTREELDRVSGQVTKLQADLDESADRLAERDRSLREARLAIQEIRLQLEGGGARDEDTGFDDVPPALADGSVGDG